MHDLDRSQIWMFEQENSVGQPKEIQLKKEEPKIEREEEKSREHDVVFTGPFNKVEPSFEHG